MSDSIKKQTPQADVDLANTSLAELVAPGALAALGRPKKINPAPKTEVAKEVQIIGQTKTESATSQPSLDSKNETESDLPIIAQIPAQIPARIEANKTASVSTTPTDHSQPSIITANTAKPEITQPQIIQPQIVEAKSLESAKQAMATSQSSASDANHTDKAWLMHDAKSLLNIMSHAPRLLWFSPCNLYDISSGAALQCRLMLKKLAQRGVKIQTLGGTAFDAPNSAWDHFPWKDELHQRKLLQVTDLGMGHTFLETTGFSVSQYTKREADNFCAVFVELLEKFKPDLVMGYGGDSSCMAMRHIVHKRGIPVIYTLWNGLHQNFSFPDVDMVLTDSHATARHYANTSNVHVQAAGIWIEPEMVLAKERKPQYVTLINPHPSKGVSIMARLALMAQKELPEVKFLAVESRCSFADGIKSLKNPDGSDANLSPDMFPNVNITPGTQNMPAIYAVTKALLAPSLWFEGWGRVSTEAVMNGIPVVASTSGGLPDSIAEGGICIQAPRECHANHTRFPTEEEAKPWLEALKRVLNEDWTERCAKAASRHNIEHNTSVLLTLLAPFFIKGARVQINPTKY